MDKYNRWGEDVWEEKINSQDEKGVIHGGGHSLKGVHKQRKEIMTYLDKKILPKIPEKSRIMDAGVGPLARFSIEFAKRDYKVVGVDVSKTTLKYAKEHIKKEGIENIELIQKNLVDLEELKEKFDFIFCFGTFGHIPKILALDTLRGFNKLLKKDRSCLVHFWLEKKPGTRKILRRFFYKVVHKVRVKISKSFEVNCSSYSKEELKELIKRSGFSLVEKSKNDLFLLKKEKEV